MKPVRRLAPPADSDSAAKAKLTQRPMPSNMKTAPMRTAPKSKGMKK